MVKSAVMDATITNDENRFIISIFITKLDSIEKCNVSMYTMASVRLLANSMDFCTNSPFFYTIRWQKITIN